MSGYLTTTDMLPALGVNAMRVNRWVNDGMIAYPATRVGGRGSGYEFRWTTEDMRVLSVIAAIDRHQKEGTRRRGAICNIHWTDLDALIRSHPSAGWLVITDDGALTFSESPEEAAAVQCSSRLAVCVRVDAA